MKKICIIPARSGSKRIKNKNIKSFQGNPIISVSIKNLKKMNFFDTIIVSTNNKKIANISKKSGADLILRRTDNLSKDNTSTILVVRDVIHKLDLKKNSNSKIFCIYPTSIFLKKKYLKKAISLFDNKNYNFIFSAVKYSHPIERSFKQKKNKLSMNFKNLKQKVTQKYPKSYHDAAQFYLAKPYSWLKFDDIFTKNSTFIEIENHEVQDIDNKTDWKIADLKFKMLKKNFYKS